MILKQLTQINPELLTIGECDALYSKLRIITVKEGNCLKQDFEEQ